MDWSPEDSDDITAYHEAGHAVASLVCRDFVGRMEFVESEDGPLAQTETWELEPPLVTDGGSVVKKEAYSHEELAAYEDAIRILMSGPAAEARYADRDFQTALERNPSDNKKINAISHSVWRDYDLVDQLAGRLRDDSIQLVEEHWLAIEALAVAFEEKRSLSGEQIREVVYSVPDADARSV